LHQLLAPFDDPDVQIWAMLNMLHHKRIPRADAIFEMHKPTLWDLHDPDGSYSEWLKQPHEFPIYMNRLYQDVPACVVYPLAEVRERFFRKLYKGKERITKFWTSTASYMVALALLQGFKRIEMYGIEMATGSNYQYQRDSMFWWVGVANGMGVEFVVPENSHLFESVLYGYRDPPNSCAETIRDV